MRKVIVLLLHIVLFFLTVSCGNHQYFLPEHIKCKCIISPTSTRHDTYLIEMSDERIITTSFGSCSDVLSRMITEDASFAQCDEVLVEQIEKKKRRTVSPQKYELLLDMLDRTEGMNYENPFVESWAWDAWIVVLITETNQFVYLRGEEPNETIKFIVNELTKMSPIPFSEFKYVGGREKISIDSKVKL